MCCANILVIYYWYFANRWKHTRLKHSAFGSIWLEHSTHLWSLLWWQSVSCIRIVLYGLFGDIFARIFRITKRLGPPLVALCGLPSLYCIANLAWQRSVHNLVFCCLPHVFQFVIKLCINPLIKNLYKISDFTVTFIILLTEMTRTLSPLPAARKSPRGIITMLFLILLIFLSCTCNSL